MSTPSYWKGIEAVPVLLDAGVTQTENVIRIPYRNPGGFDVAQQLDSLRSPISVHLRACGRRRGGPEDERVGQDRCSVGEAGVSATGRGRTRDRATMRRLGPERVPCRGGRGRRAR